MRHALVALLAIGCATELPAPSEAYRFDQARTYEIQLFEDPDECENSWLLYNMNCYQLVQFCPDGMIDVVVTDIVNRGAYVVVGDEIITDFEGNFGDVMEMSFEVISETEIMSESGAVWTLDEDGFHGSPCL